MSRSRATSKVKPAGSARCSILVVLLLSLLPGWRARAIQEGYVPWDLRVLTAEVAEFKVEQVSVEVALGRLFAKVLGNSEQVHVEIRAEDGSVPVLVDGRSISLDVSNIKAVEVIQHIAELGGCRWSIGRIGEGASIFRLTPITTGDTRREDRFLTVAIPCTDKAAQALGLKSEMKPSEVATLLSRYGMEINHDQAAWNPKVNILVVNGPPKVVEYFRSLVILCENGWQLTREKTSSSKSK